MKKAGIKTLYRLFSFLSDSIGGFNPFVRYKLVLGALLIGLTANACKNKTGSPDNALTKESPETELSKELKQDTVVVEDSIASGEEKIIPPVMYVPVPCYMGQTVISPHNAINGVLYYDMEILDEQPSFPGGDEALQEFISDNYCYPKDSPAPTAKIIAKFAVKSTGEIEDIDIRHTMISDEFTKETIRLIESMPCWIPGMYQGEAVNVYYTLTIKVKKPEYEKE